LLRVYVDDWNPPIWQIDSGPGTASRKFEKVITNAVGEFKYDLTANNTSEPKAWVEYPEAELKIFNTIALLR
jgi:hypothetical protein